MERIVAYCKRIDSNLSRYDRDYSAFMGDEMFQDACCMCVIQIGELAGELSDEAKALNSAIPWRVIKDTRNFYVHAYGSIDLASVWETLVNDIPELRTNCEALLRSAQ